MSDTEKASERVSLFLGGFPAKEPLALEDTINLGPDAIAAVPGYEPGHPNTLTASDVRTLLDAAERPDLAALFQRAWQCEKEVRFGQKTGLCGPGKPHNLQTFDCGWRWKAPALTDDEADHYGIGAGQFRVQGTITGRLPAEQEKADG